MGNLANPQSIASCHFTKYGPSCKFCSDTSTRYFQKTLPTQNPWKSELLKCTKVWSIYGRLLALIPACGSSGEWTGIPSTVLHHSNHSTISMLRLLSSKAQGRNHFWKLSKTLSILLVFIGKLSLSTLRWVPMCQGFSHFFGFLHHFVLAKLATSSISVKYYGCNIISWNFCPSRFSY